MAFSYLLHHLNETAEGGGKHQKDKKPTTKHLSSIKLGARECRLLSTGSHKSQDVKEPSVPSRGRDSK